MLWQCWLGIRKTSESVENPAVFTGFQRDHQLTQCLWVFQSTLIPLNNCRLLPFPFLNCKSSRRCVIFETLQLVIKLELNFFIISEDYCLMQIADFNDNLLYRQTLSLILCFALFTVFPLLFSCCLVSSVTVCAEEQNQRYRRCPVMNSGWAELNFENLGSSTSLSLSAASRQPVSSVPLVASASSCGLLSHRQSRSTLPYSVRSVYFTSIIVGFIKA